MVLYALCLHEDYDVYDIGLMFSSAISLLVNNEK